MTQLNVTNARCAALFASQLQRSDTPAPDAVTEAIRRTVRQFGVRGCASRMAQEFGDHPERGSPQTVRLAGAALARPAQPAPP